MGFIPFQTAGGRLWSKLNMAPVLEEPLILNFAHLIVSFQHCGATSPVYVATVDGVIKLTDKHQDSCDPYMWTFHRWIQVQIQLCITFDFSCYTLSSCVTSCFLDQIVYPCPQMFGCMFLSSIFPVFIQPIFHVNSNLPAAIMFSGFIQCWNVGQTAAHVL